LVASEEPAFNAFQKTLGAFGIQLDYALYEEIYSPNWHRMYRLAGLPEKQWREADKLWLQYYGRKIPALVPNGREVLAALQSEGFCLG